MAKSAWEAKLLAAVEAALRPGDIFFDIGAWIGPYTLLGSRLVKDAGRVYAFEPDPIAKQLLDRNIDANLCSNVTVVQAAVSDRDGFAPFITESNLADSNSRLADCRSPFTCDVQTYRLDSFCLLNNVIPDIVKIDIEGGERIISSGFGNSLNRARTIFMEVHHQHLAALGVDAPNFIRDMASTLGATTTQLDDGPMASRIVFTR